MYDTATRAWRRASLSAEQRRAARNSDASETSDGTCDAGEPVSLYHWRRHQRRRAIQASRGPGGAAHRGALGSARGLARQKPMPPTRIAERRTSLPPRHVTRHAQPPARRRWRYRPTTRGPSPPPRRRRRRQGTGMLSLGRHGLSMCRRGVARPLWAGTDSSSSTAPVPFPPLPRSCPRTQEAVQVPLPPLPRPLPRRPAVSPHGCSVAGHDEPSRQACPPRRASRQRRRRSRTSRLCRGPGGAGIEAH